MPNTSIRQLENEPIVVMTYEGEFGVADLAAFAPVAAVMQRDSRIPLYWVFDLSAITTDFGQILKMLAQQSQAQTGTAANAPNRFFWSLRRRWYACFSRRLVCRSSASSTSRSSPIWMTHWQRCASVFRRRQTAKQRAGS